MRHALILALLVTAAHADTRIAAKTAVYKDANGRFYVLPKRDVVDGDLAREMTFYGDGRTLHQQQIVGFSSIDGTISLAIWAPRVRGLTYALIEYDAAGVHVVCSKDERKFIKQPLTAVSDADAAKLFAKAKLLPPLWRHRTMFAGREATTYYLLDRLQAGEGHRLFVGPKGKLKQIPITDFAADSGGVVVVTKAGSLEVPQEGPATWRRGQKTLEIAAVDPTVNAYLIYRELGVYGQLGTVCEDQ